MTAKPDTPYRRAIDYGCFAVLLVAFALTMLRRSGRSVDVDAALRSNADRTIDWNATLGAVAGAGDTLTRDDVAVRLDPNTAEWWELTELPGIGPTKARAIVEYRERFREEYGAENPGLEPPPAFDEPADLDHVKGIGPKTVEKLRDMLTFASVSSAQSRANE